jgi:hypothetical protein
MPYGIIDANCYYLEQHLINPGACFLNIDSSRCCLFSYSPPGIKQLENLV